MNIIRVNKERVNIEKRMRKIFPYTVFTVYGSGYNRLYHGKGE